MASSDTIFLSYSRRDSELALRLAQDLRAQSIPIWVDQVDIAPGTMWDRAVEQALATSKKVLILLSESSVESDNVLDEITLALDEGKELVPVLLEPCRVPLRLRRKQHIDFTNTYEDGFARLLESLSHRTTDSVDGGRLGDTPLKTASMAVIPLRVLTADEQSRLIAAGAHDEVTNGLSRIPAFHVVSAATTRTLTGDATSLRRVASEFGVRYAITGSIALASGRLRAQVELCDIAAAKVLWDERFDVEMNDLFDVIDQITAAIVSRLHPHVFSAEIRRLGRKSADEMSAWELVHRARMVRWTRKGLNESIALLRRSLELDADSALAHAELARALSVLAQWDGRLDLFGEMTTHAKKAMKIAPDDPAGLVASCVAYNNFGRHAEGLAAGSRAIELNPNHADAWACAGFSLSGLGRSNEAIRHIERGIDLSPRDPLLYVWHLFLSHAHLMGGDREAAIAENRESLRLFPSNFMAHMTLAVNLAVVGDHAQARLHWAEAKHLFPDVSVDFFVGFCAVQKYPDAMLAIDRAAIAAAGLDVI